MRSMPICGVLPMISGINGTSPEHVLPLRAVAEPRDTGLLSGLRHAAVGLAGQRASGEERQTNFTKEEQVTMDDPVGASSVRPDAGRGNAQAGRMDAFPAHQ